MVAEVQRHLHLPDPGALYVVLGAVAANMLDGAPVWFMLIGAPSSGKTELLRTTLGVPGMFDVGTISGVSSFLSATAQRDRAKDASGGIFRQVGQHGGLLIDDFASVLTQGKDLMRTVLDVFRQAYKGSYTRDVGVDGGRKIIWRGRVGFLGGVTGAIDQYTDVSSSLGERWVYWRFEEDAAITGEKSRRALSNAAGGEGWRSELQAAVGGFFADLGLGFAREEGQQPMPRRELTGVESSRVILMAEVAARCRSAVLRDLWSRDREIIAARETEASTRVATVLGQLLVGMEAVGIPEPERWRQLGKVALDSMPQMRRAAVNACRNPEGGAWLDTVVERIGASRAVVVRVVEDLEIHDVVRVEKRGGRVWVGLMAAMREGLERGFR